MRSLHCDLNVTLFHSISGVCGYNSPPGVLQAAMVRVQVNMGMVDHLPLLGYEAAFSWRAERWRSTV